MGLTLAVMANSVEMEPENPTPGKYTGPQVEGWGSHIYIQNLFQSRRNSGRKMQQKLQDRPYNYCLNMGSILLADTKS